MELCSRNIKYTFCFTSKLWSNYCNNYYDCSTNNYNNNDSSNYDCSINFASTNNYYDPSTNNYNNYDSSNWMVCFILYKRSCNIRRRIFLYNSIITC
jgi:hypothetical protein